MRAQRERYGSPGVTTAPMGACERWQALGVSWAGVSLACIHQACRYLLSNRKPLHSHAQKFHFRARNFHFPVPRSAVPVDSPPVPVTPGPEHVQASRLLVGQLGIGRGCLW